MSLCDNSAVLFIFILIKIFIYVIFPIIIIKNRKKQYIGYMIITEIILLLTILICNVFSLNKCIYSSNISGIKKSNLEKTILDYNALHYSEEEYQNITDIEPDEYYKTYTGKDFYYYNQNNVFLKNKELECNDNKYFNKYGSSITSTSMAVSTILQLNISPIDILDLYNSEIYDCSDEINIGDVFKVTADRYSGLQISEIDSTLVKSSIINGGIVIAEINSNGSSKITCGKNHIVLYNITLEGNVIFADPNDSENSFVCSYSSQSFGSVLTPNRTNSEWSFDEINSQTIHYYLVKGV